MTSQTFPRNTWSCGPQRLYCCDRSAEVGHAGYDSNVVEPKMNTAGRGTPTKAKHWTGRQV